MLATVRMRECFKLPFLYLSRPLFCLLLNKITTNITLRNLRRHKTTKNKAKDTKVETEGDKLSKSD